MKQIQSRIAEVLIYSGLNVKAFAKRVGLPYASFYSCINNTRPANLEMIQKICESFPEIDERWLLLGEGEMITPKMRELLRKSGQ